MDKCGRPFLGKRKERQWLCTFDISRPSTVRKFRSGNGGWEMRSGNVFPTDFLTRISRPLTVGDSDGKLFRTCVREPERDMNFQIGKKGMLRRSWVELQTIWPGGFNISRLSTVGKFWSGKVVRKKFPDLIS